MNNTRVGHYEILDKLGEGGMGVVYKARDTKLDRPVALKFLPAHLSGSEQDKARFTQEAKAAAALNHPNVCSIFDIQEHDGQMFIVMEYVDGQTLRGKAGSFSMKQAIDIGIQIAEGLAAAHEKGIVHRDIKPENIMIRKDGIVQIMDFGLAKLRASQNAITRLTRQGSTVGTAGYMSPEQVQGHEADHRSDIFSLGVVLYELFTGQLPFKGVHETALAYEIVNVDSPPMSSTKSEIPPELDAIVLDCVEKDPQERTQAASQVALELKRYRRESSRQRASRITASRVAPPVSGIRSQENVLADAPTDAVQTPKKSVKPVVAVFAISAAALALGLGLGKVLFADGPGVDPIRSTLRTPHGLVFGSRNGGHSAISPDGKHVVFVGVDSTRTAQLWLWELRQDLPVALAGTRNAEYPFWSHDSRSIGYFASGKLKRVDIAGSPPQTLADAPSGRGGAWGPSGMIVFAPSVRERNLFVVSASGGNPVQLTHFDSTGGPMMVPRFPSFLPDGEHFLFVMMSLNEGGSIEREDYRSYVGALDGTVVPISLTGVSNMHYASDRLIYLRQGTLIARPFDPGSYNFSGEPVPLAANVNFWPQRAKGDFSVSRNGILTYGGSYVESSGEFFWLERDGRKISVVGGDRQAGVNISPDQKKIAYSVESDGNTDVWIYDLERKSNTRFTFDAGIDIFPSWSRDGSRIYFSSDRNGEFAIYQKPTNGLSNEEPVSNATGAFVLDVRPDDNVLLEVLVRDQTSSTKILALDLKTAKETVVVQGAFRYVNPVFSPDGRWVAYQSNESGNNEIYVIPFLRGGSKWQISTGGGVLPLWEKSGEIFYSKPGRVMVVNADVAAATPKFSIPREALSLGGETGLRIVDVTNDGKRFLAHRVSEGGRKENLSLISQWPALVTKE